MNTDLLYLEPMQTNLECEIETYFVNNRDGGVSSHMVWDMMKAVVRGKAISIAATYKKEKQNYWTPSGSWNYSTRRCATPRLTNNCLLNGKNLKPWKLVRYNRIFYTSSSDSGFADQNS